MIEEAENVLRDMGFYEVRVRHHELRGQRSGGTDQNASLSTLNPQPSVHLARIELGANEIPRLLEDGKFGEVGEQLKRIGYAHVTLDLAGYRRGSLNQSPMRFGAPASTPV